MQSYPEKWGELSASFHAMNSTTAERDCSAEGCHVGTVVEVQGVSKRFGNQIVVRQFSMSCGSGEIVLVLGSNGAGKSTLLRMIAGLVTPDSGSIKVASGQRIGFAGHYTCLYSRLSVNANLSLYATLAGIGQIELAQILRRWQLEEVQHKAVSDISRGAQSKASLARALMGNPKLLLLDEPSSNLDEEATEVLCAVLSERVAAGSVAIIATHDLARLQALATRVVVMQCGAIIADSGLSSTRSSLDSVVERYRKSNR
jgi:ABC-type multidrug transport system ATPase subunit